MVKLVGLTNSVGVREEYSFLQICLRIEEARKIIWVMRLVSDIGDPSRPINKHLAEALCLALEDPEASHLDRHNIEWGGAARTLPPAACSCSDSSGDYQ
jgi:hypothetical protein